MAKLEAVTEATFEGRVTRARGNVLVEFTAQWCPPCRALEPVLEELAREQGDTLTILKADADENEGVRTRYGVMALPTLILFRDGEPVKQLIGARPKATLLRELAPHLAR